jgi:dienelactone hydrolase
MPNFARIVSSFIACGALFVACAADAAWRESDEAIKSRSGVTVSVLVARAVVAEGAGEKAEVVEPTQIAVFFPGADGKIRAARPGLSQHGANPATMGVLAEKFGMAVAFGLPSDQSDGISMAWRLGNDHIADAGAVLDSLTARFPKARFTLIGMSNGGRTVTRVAAAVARRGAPALQAVVVMSAAPEALIDDVVQPIIEAKVPIMVIHHKRDSCLPFRDMEAAAANKPRYTFVAIDDPKQPRVSAFSRDCNPGSAHVFGGKTAEVYSLIAEWVQTGRAPKADSQ